MTDADRHMDRHALPHMQVYFKGIRIAPSKDMSQDDVQKWVKELKPHNDMMVS